MSNNPSNPQKINGPDDYKRALSRVVALMDAEAGSSEEI